MRGTPLLLAVLLLPCPGPGPSAAAQDRGPEGPPAFVPLESSAAAARLRAAAALAAEGRLAEAAAAYQDIVDGPLWDRLAPLEADPDTLEQARERALREVAALPPLRAAWRARFGETAQRLLDGDPAARRQVFDRFPLTDAGGAAGLALARDAYRRGRPHEALGVLDRLRDLLPPGDPAPAPLLALAGAAAAATGDGDLLAAVAAEAAPRAAAPAPGGLPLGDFLALRRAALAPAPAGPRGPLVQRWQWTPDEAHLPPGDAAGEEPVYPNELPPRPDHLVAVRGGVVYWTDRLRVTALDLSTGAVRGRSVPVASRPTGPVPAKEVRGESFAPAADARGVVAALDLPDPGPGGHRVGGLYLFDPSLRLLVRRGGDGDLEHPELTRRYVYHGRPLLVGDRVLVAATESGALEGGGDVRTHLLCFRRSDLALLWDTFLAYGSGIHESNVAPPGSPAHRHGRVYLATHTGLQVCVDGRTGAVLWAHRYRTPEMAPTPRLATQPDRTSDPVLWYECPPSFSGDLVAFAPRDSYHVYFLRQRPLPGSGRVRMDFRVRPRFDTADLTTLWVVPGPAGGFFLAGQTSGREEAPLLLFDLAEGADRRVPWRGPVMEPTVAGLPVRTRDAVYLATEKAIYRIPWPGRDGEVEVLASLPPVDPEEPRPLAGNLVVLPDAVLSVSNGGILCFGPPPPMIPK